MVTYRIHIKHVNNVHSKEADHTYTCTGNLKFSISMLHPLLLDPTEHEEYVSSTSSQQEAEESMIMHNNTNHQLQPAAASSNGPTSIMKAAAVDLTLASTYIPAITCLLRTTMLVVLMSRDWATHSMPTLIILGIFMYVDRVVRQEIIFDSSALTCTVYAMHVLNLCRSSIAHIDDPAAALHAVQSHQRDMIMLSRSAVDYQSNNITASPHQQEALVASLNMMRGRHYDGWQQQLMLVTYSVVSLLLLLEIDVASIAVPTKPGASCVVLMQNALEAGENCIKVSTIVLHCVLVGCIMQIPVNQQVFVVPWKIMARSFLFAFLSIFWTYAVGIHHASIHIRSYPYYYNPVLQRKYVQPFTPCQLRFLVVLLLDGWLLAVCGTLMMGVTLRQLSFLLNGITAAASASSSAPVSGYSHAQEEEALVVQKPFSKALQQPQQQLSEDFTSASVPSAPSGVHSLQVAPTSGQGESSGNADVALMFRLAQKAASQRVGEQI